MKQIYAILLAALLPLCASAQQLRPTVGISPKRSVKTTMRSTLSTPNAPSANKARRAEEKVINISCTGDYTFEYYKESEDWYYNAVSDDDNYVVRLDYITNDEAKNTGTFTYADLNADYSFITDFTGIQ